DPERDEPGLSLRQDVLDPGFHGILPPGRAQHARGHHTPSGPWILHAPSAPPPPPGICARDHGDVTWVWLLWSEGSGGESEGVLVAAEVVALVFPGDVPGPVGAGVAAGGDGAEPEDGLGSFESPAGAGDAHPVLHQVAAGALDDAGGD